ncbi:MAG: metal-dependent hydrolase [Haloarculaceae archaeon]
MNKRGHVLNAILLSIGLGYVLEPAGDIPTFVTIAEVSVPIVLGALFPDVDTAFGKHRKTLHNVVVLGVVAAYPFYFGNLQWVWLGVLTHYVLDVIGSRRGIAFFYPLSGEEFGMPGGVTTSSDYAEIVTTVVTGIELAIIAVLVHVVPGYLPSGATNAVQTLLF